MVKIYVEMDEGWRWWPVTEQDEMRQYRSKPMSMEVPDELVAEYKTAREAYWAVQEKLEALFRVQQGYTPHPNQPIPEHKMLKSDKNNE